LTPVSKQDPKHGRWILPLVVAALVLFTWTFVNALPPAETGVTNTTVAAGTTTTTTAAPPETTTTTLPPDVVEFIATADSLAATAAELRTTAETINSEYDGEVTGYGATRDALSQLRASTSEFNESVAAVDVPTAAAERWADVTTAAAAMSRAADDMLDGLVNTAGSEKRLGALEDYTIAAATFAQAIDSAKAAASGSSS
jgi:hypothetical protein